MSKTENPAALAAQAVARAQSKTVLLPAGKTAYWFYPAAAGASAPTLVMIHGYRGNHHGLEAIAAALPDCNVIIPDLPGFGLSQPLGGTHSVVAYAEWLGQFVPAVADSTAVVMGHSFGSIVTAAAAANGLANPLILVNPVARFSTRQDQRFLNFLVDTYYQLGGNLPKPMANSLLRNPMFVRIMSEVLAKTKNSQLRGWIHQQHHKNFSDFADRRIAVEGYHASVSQSVVSYAEKFSNPTLLVAGELDDITSLADQHRAAKLFIDAKLTVLPAVGHLIHYECPEAVAALIQEFVQSQAR